MTGALELIGFGAKGWGAMLLQAALVTVAVSVCGAVLGAIIGAALATVKIRGGRASRLLAETYTTVLRGVPDLLIIYLLYFGGSSAISAVGRLFGAEGFIGLPAFATGAVAIGIISAAYQAEVYRGAYKAISPGEVEAARAAGMRGWIIFRRIVGPQVLRFSLPGLGNIWQLALKESALISVIGLVELLRAASLGAGSTRQPFTFYFVAIAIYLMITTISTRLFIKAERSTPWLRHG